LGQGLLQDLVRPPVYVGKEICVSVFSGPQTDQVVASICGRTQYKVMAVQAVQRSAQDIGIKGRAVGTDEEGPVSSLPDYPGQGMLHSLAEIASLLAVQGIGIAQPVDHLLPGATAVIDLQLNFSYLQDRLYPTEDMDGHLVVELGGPLGAEPVDQSGLNRARLWQSGKENYMFPAPGPIFFIHQL